MPKLLTSPRPKPIIVELHRNPDLLIDSHVWREFLINFNLIGWHNMLLTIYEIQKEAIANNDAMQGHAVIALKYMATSMLN